MAVCTKIETACTFTMPAEDLGISSQLFQTETHVRENMKRTAKANGFHSLDSDKTNSLFIARCH